MKNPVNYVVEYNWIYDSKSEYFECKNRELKAKYAIHNNKLLVLVLLDTNQQLNKRIKGVKMLIQNKNYITVKYKSRELQATIEIKPRGIGPGI